jgi:hypothetical protein
LQDAVERHRFVRDVNVRREDRVYGDEIVHLDSASKNMKFPVGLEESRR